jgi:hypothetical protein
MGSNMVASRPVVRSDRSLFVSPVPERPADGTGPEPGATALYAKRLSGQKARLAEGAANGIS